MQIITQENVRFNTCRSLLHRLSPICVSRYNSLSNNFANKKTSMVRSTFKVLFYVNGSKEKNGIVPIMGRVTINGSVAQFSCKQTIPKTLWDAKGNCNRYLCTNKFQKLAM